MEPSPGVDKRKLKEVDYFNNFDFLTSDTYCTRENKTKIAISQESIKINS